MSTILRDTEQNSPVPRETTVKREVASPSSAPGSPESPAESNYSSDTIPHRQRRRGRKPNKVDMKGRLEKSRQSARECRARKKLRYQYVEELVADRQRAIFSLREELDTYRKSCHKVDQGQMPNEVKKLVESTGRSLPCASSTESGRPTESGDL